MSDDMFGSLLNFKFIFGFSGGFGLFLYSLIPFVPDNNKSSSRIYIGIIIIMMLFTFKSQVLFFVLIFLIFYFFEFFLRTRLKVSHMAIIVILILLILYPTISNYFITSAYSPRKVLLEGALDLMKEHFPIGTGFATFASPMAAKDYSPIYIERGYYFLFGMGAFDGIQYLSDNYLAAVIGQFGFIGIILFLLETLLLIKFIISKQLGINEKIYSLTAVLALVGTTLGSSYYTSAAGALIMVVAGITVARGEN